MALAAMTESIPETFEASPETYAHAIGMLRYEELATPFMSNQPLWLLLFVLEKLVTSHQIHQIRFIQKLSDSKEIFLADIEGKHTICLLLKH